MHFKDWKIEEITGYKPQTTYYMDLSIADAFGTDAIIDTYNNVMENIDVLGYVYLTEFVMALNWKIHEHYGNNDVYATLYNELWMRADNYAVNTLKGEELTYFYRTTD